MGKNREILENVSLLRMLKVREISKNVSLLRMSVLRIRLYNIISYILLFNCVLLRRQWIETFMPSSNWNILSVTSEFSFHKKNTQLLNGNNLLMFLTQFLRRGIIRHKIIWNVGRRLVESTVQVNASIFRMQLKEIFMFFTRSSTPRISGYQFTFRSERRS